MNDVAIRVEGLGKQYRIGRRERYRTLRDTITETITAPVRRFGSLLSKRTSQEEPGDLIWALRDVSFEVPAGSVLGVIGRNGAGKSTLLKILSRITEQTEGRIEIRGRVGSLLEVGTGFHPELSGRENIFLNGAILGMRRAEIARKFDEIVSFAEVERFIDTPVKHYSTGMYMRLAFAVAAHLETEILLVDEVLAVGDLKFQRKCLGRMEDVARAGWTVLLVSHSLAAMASLCSAGLLLDEGELRFEGSMPEAIQSYHESLYVATEAVDFRSSPPTGRGAAAKIVEASMLSGTGVHRSQFEFGDDVVVEFALEALRECEDQLCAVIIRTSTGTPVLHLMSHNSSSRPFRVPGDAIVRCTIPQCPLYPGIYTVSIWVGTTPYSETDCRHDALRFEMTPGELLSVGFDLNWRHGLVQLDNRWEVSSRQDQTLVRVASYS
jgi:lipopolysaccharide transport system ATP-binding protein